MCLKQLNQVTIKQPTRDPHGLTKTAGIRKNQVQDASTVTQLGSLGNVGANFERFPHNGKRYEDAANMCEKELDH